MTPEEVTPLSTGEQKIEDYVTRIRNGESKESIFQGLPESFISGIEKRLSETNSDKKKYGLADIPSQYKGMDSETLNEMWTFPEYIDEEKNKTLQEMKEGVLAALREKESRELSRAESINNEQTKIEKLRIKAGAVNKDTSLHELTREDLVRYLEQKVRTDYENLSPEQIKEQIALQYNLELRKRGNALGDDLFSAGISNYSEDEKGTIKTWQSVSGEIGQHFDAHGIAKLDQLNKLINLLDNGVDQSQDFYSAPFELPQEVKAGAGAGLGTSGGTAYKDGIAVVTSGYDQKIAKDGIQHVFLNDVFEHIKEPLSKAYPQYKFHLLSEQKTVLEHTK